jgi:hypothetical protein
MDSLRLDVFGTIMLARHADHRWQLSIPGHEGKSRPVFDLVIPSDVITPEELVGFLSDVYHEASSPDKPTVTILTETQ